MASDLFEESVILETLKGKGICVTLVMPTDKACNHVQLLYNMAKFDSQPVSKVLADNGATLNVLPTLILMKLGKKILIYCLLIIL